MNQPTSLELIDDSIIGFEMSYVNDKSHIIDNLWIGQRPEGSSAFEFDYVVCLVQQPTYVIKNWQTVLVAPFEDHYTLPPIEFLHRTAEMTLSFMKKGKTLVHCQAGVNRSGLIAGLALVKQGMSPQEAINLLRGRRGKWMLHNGVFEEWLLKGSEAK